MKERKGSIDTDDRDNRSFISQQTDELGRGRVLFQRRWRG